MSVILSEPNKVVLISRGRSLLWRLAGMVAAGGLYFIVQAVGLLELPAWSVPLVGLVIGEVTKYVNSNYPWVRAEYEKLQK